MEPEFECFQIQKMVKSAIYFFWLKMTHTSWKISKNVSILVTEIRRRGWLVRQQSKSGRKFFNSSPFVNNSSSSLFNCVMARVNVEPS